METCILIPREFNVVLKPFATPPSPPDDSSLRRGWVERSRPPNLDKVAGTSEFKENVKFRQLMEKAQQENLDVSPRKENGRGERCAAAPASPSAAAEAVARRDRWLQRRRPRPRLNTLPEKSNGSTAARERSPSPEFIVASPPAKDFSMASRDGDRNRASPMDIASSPTPTPERPEVLRREHNGHSRQASAEQGSFDRASPTPPSEQAAALGTLNPGVSTEPFPRRQPLRPVAVYSPLEMGATVWANVPLFPGQVFHPDQGEIRLDHLEIYSVLPKYDVSTQHCVLPLFVTLLGIWLL